MFSSVKPKIMVQFMNNVGRARAGMHNSSDKHYLRTYKLKLSPLNILALVSATAYRSLFCVYKMKIMSQNSLHIMKYK